MKKNWDKEVDLTETVSHYVRPTPEHLDHGTDNEPFNPTHFASSNNRTPQPINPERLQPMQTSTFFNIYGDWSLFVEFSVSEIASGHKATKPLSGFHPYEWQVLKDGKMVAKGTAPSASKNGTIPYGVTNKELDRLIVALGADQFVFSSRVNKESQPDVRTLKGWNVGEQQELTPERIEQMEPEAIVETMKPKTVARRKAAN